LLTVALVATRRAARHHAAIITNSKLPIAFEPRTAWHAAKRPAGAALGLDYNARLRVAGHTISR
jgi:hypothetical protein